MANDAIDLQTEVAGYPRPGDVLDERYELTEIINAGGMGMIMRARQLTMDRDVAVKLLLPGKVGREATRTRFEREVHLAKQLTHPNIIRLYDYGRHGPFLYLVMELLEGEDLKALLYREGHLAVARALEIAIQVADALTDAHRRNIVHRDLKPGNVFIVRLGSNRDFVKVLDFGIAKSLDSKEFDVTSTGEVSGTVAYIAPEIVTGSGPGKGADVYAVGILLMEMITGRKVFEGLTVAETLMNHMQAPLRLPPSIANTRLAEVLERVLAKDPGDRYRDAGELLAGLNSVVRDVPPTLRVSRAEIEATYGPLPTAGEASSGDLMKSAPARRAGTQLGYELADVGTTQVTPASISEEAVRGARSAGNSMTLEAFDGERRRWPLVAGVVAVAIAGAIATDYVWRNYLVRSETADTAATPAEPLVAAPTVEAAEVPAPVVEEPAILDVGVAELAFDVGIEEPPVALVSARDGLLEARVAAELAAATEPPTPVESTEEPTRKKKRREEQAKQTPRKKRNQKEPQKKAPEPVEKLDVFAATATPAEPKNPEKSGPELFAAAKQSFIAGNHHIAIEECKKALAKGESGCNALLANSYRLIGDEKTACKYYRKAGIDHKSCMTLQSR